MNASAEVVEGDLIKVESYEVEMWLGADREVRVEEEIEVTFLQSGLTMFYRSLPTEGARYENIRATCEGNSAFSYDVIDNPDTDGFIDVECVGNAAKGATWTYDIAYTMLPNAFEGDYMAIDLVGFGWSVDLHNVEATLHLPATPIDHAVYIGGYGATGGSGTGVRVSEDGRTITVEKPLLEKTYNAAYGESMAAGITVGFTMPAGVLASYADARIFTDSIGWLFLCAALLIVVAIALTLLLRRKGEIIKTVHIKPPQGMSPMQMGKILDGSVDNEDTTSMIYYFASKGYLKIDFTDENDPELTRLVYALPEEAPAHEKTLFKGLFAAARTEKVDDLYEVQKVKVSQLVMKFHEASQAAKAQVAAPKPMYTSASKWAFALLSVLGGVFVLVACLIMGKRIGGGYSYPWGFLAFLPIAVTMTTAVAKENYRYKWKTGAKIGVLAIQLAVSAIYSLIFVFAAGEFFMTEWEKLVIVLGGLIPSFIAPFALSRTEKYEQTLGDILGFKEFIVTTEEDRIEAMLAENPELYYDILPYAQVLGVTDEWERKFARITLSPPSWYTGRPMTAFDYLMINRCMRLSMARELARAMRASQGGGHIGRSGGGGGFGGFGGGGFGGGGGGAR